MGCAGHAPPVYPRALGRQVLSPSITCEVGSSSDFHQRYSLGVKLGEGAFGQVRAAWHRKTRELRAVKFIALLDGSNVIDQSLVRSARREARIWRQLGSHDHCVELYETFLDSTLFYMVMEKCEASLMDQLQEMPRMGETGVARIYREMLLGIRHIHSVGVVHRDVKPNNFLFGGPSGRTVKLCDFGMAARVPRKGGLLYGSYGTAPYMSPEMVSDRGHSFCTDIWSFGATAYVLLYGDFPYVPAEACAKAMKAAVRCGEPAPRFERYFPGGEGMRPPSGMAEAFVRNILEREPLKRLTARQALQLPFVRLGLSASGLLPSSTDAVPTSPLPQLLEKGTSSAAKVKPPAPAQSAAATGKGTSVQSAKGAIKAVMRSFSGRMVREEPGLAPVLREARKRTHQFKAPINPIVQRSLDEILRRLQQPKGSEKYYFSEPASGDVHMFDDQEEVEEPVTRRESKRSTHSGIVNRPALSIAAVAAVAAVAGEASPRPAPPATPKGTSEEAETLSSPVFRC